MVYKQLKEILLRHESNDPKSPLTACITFASFGPNVKEDYPWKSRTYVISSDNKAFQPGQGDYSIFGKCLDGTGPYLRLSQLMKDECGGNDGWTIEDCAIAGYLLIGGCDYDIPMPKLFYGYNDALEYMLFRLAEIGKLDVDQIKKDLTTIQEVCRKREDCGEYCVNQDSAHLSDPITVWRWKIQPACIYGPMNIVFPDQEDTLNVDASPLKYE